MPYLQLLRPSQWSKNLFVFAGLVFGRKLTGPDAASSMRVTLLAFACLCLISSAVYIVNDIHDRHEDKLHPRKRYRPIASGAVSIAAAATLVAALLLIGLGGGWLFDRAFGLVATTYLVLQIGYTFGFKHAVILDVIVIGLGFVLRAVAGVVVLEGVEISPWLVLCTFTLCLFMGFSKRRCELNALAENGATSAGQHRKTLSIYTPDLLNHMTTLTAGIAIVSFMLYTIDDRTIDRAIRYEDVTLSLDKGGAGMRFSAAANGPSGRWTAVAIAKGAPGGRRDFHAQFRNFSIDEISLAGGFRTTRFDTDAPLSFDLRFALGPGDEVLEASGQMEIGRGYFRFDEPDHEPVMIEKIAGVAVWDRAARKVAIAPLVFKAGGFDMTVVGDARPPEGARTIADAARLDGPWTIALRLKAPTVV
ncbi:MAG: UbiA prenyltransferase family protein, partial [Planctomycetes bacterium]|nr:UbiA prenyltransferase family protein [Planctomycetota bacterium]